MANILLEESDLIERWEVSLSHSNNGDGQGQAQNILK